MQFSPKQFDICNSYNLSFFWFFADILVIAISSSTTFSLLFHLNVLPSVLTQHRLSSCLSVPAKWFLWGGPIYASRVKLNQHCIMCRMVKKKKQQQKFITFVYACQMTMVAPPAHRQRNTQNTQTRARARANGSFESNCQR